MQNQINSIQVKNSLFRGLRIQNIVFEKDIYKQGQRCDVKFVRIQQSNQNNPTNSFLSQQIKKSKYALKVISKQRIKDSTQNYQTEYDAIYNQIYALYLLDHPNVIKLHWHHQDQNSIYLLMEYGGTKLLTYSRKQTLTEEQIKSLFKQICQGFKEMHCKSIMHRDLCLQNLLISTSNNNLVKIIDFDHAIEFTGGRESAQGMLSSMAPEVYYHKRYNSKADIWSLGVVLYELFHKRNPFVDQSKPYTQEEFVQKRDKLQFEISPEGISQEAKKLIEKMLALNPEKRPSIDEILKSKWITGRQTSEPASKNVDILSSDDKKTRQIPNNNRKSFSGFSISDKGETSQLQNNFNDFDRKSNKEDDFFFDKMINKMTMDNTVQQLENRLKWLLKVKTEELNRKKQFTLKYLAIQKKKIQQDREKLNR